MLLSSAGYVMLLILGILLAACHALENTTEAITVSDPPVAAAVRSHFLDCPDAHINFCFHGTCRYLVQEEEPACVCLPGFAGKRCEHADLLAVVAASQKKNTITALVAVAVICTGLLITGCILMHCCSWKKHREWCRSVMCRQEKPDGLYKGGASCCKSETGDRASVV
ncbi:protransforming growth factor alpha [Ranitomeya imitator]|uniref:protransforming growth factor alpha n=1 Tax=Ranitomeya imitator TaxID=111125 RepID=UPI001AA3188C